MPPRVQLFSAPRALPIRSRISNVSPFQLRAVPNSRSFADKSTDLPVADNGKGPNSESLPHVSEEAATMAKVTGTEGPDINQGTPVDKVRSLWDNELSCASATIADIDIIDCTGRQGSR